MRDALRLSRTAAAWGGRFYLHHFLLVFGLSMIPTGQRFVVVGFDPPTWAAVASEVLVAGVRILLVVLIVRLMLGDAGLGGRAFWFRLTAAVNARRAAFWWQWVILAIAFAIFDILPNVLIATFVPAGDRTAVNAILVAAKNPTVIAFTVLWMAGIARTLVVEQRVSAAVRASPRP